MRNLFTITFFVLASSLLTVCNAQTWHWAKEPVRLPCQVDWGIALDRNDNTYTTGYWKSYLGSDTIVFGNDTIKYTATPGTQQNFLYKYDINGNELWGKTAKLNGNGNIIGSAVAVDKNDNVYETGYFQDSIKFGAYALYSAVPNTDVFLVKYNPNGNVVWALSATGITNSSSSWSVTTDSKNNVYVSGTFLGSMDFGAIHLVASGIAYDSGDVFLAKFDSNGNGLWAKSEGKGYPYSIVIDHHDNVCMTGYFDSRSISFGSHTLINGGNWNVFLVKYDSSGNVKWAKSGIGIAQDFANSVAVDINDNVYITGGYTDAPLITFGSITLNDTTSESAVFLVKYDSSGNALWAKTAIANTSFMFGSNGMAVTTDQCGNVWLASGLASDTVSIGSLLLTSKTDSFSSSEFIVKFDSSGGSLNGFIIPTGGTFYSLESGGLAIDSKGNAHICFTPNYGVKLGADSMKISSCGSTPVTGDFSLGAGCLAADVHSVSKNNVETVLFPNPNNGKFTIQLANSYKLTATSSIEIYNMLGEKIYSETLSIKNSTLNIDLQSKSPGVYMYRLVTETGEQVANGKFIIE